MHPDELGKKYDRIAQWWHEQQDHSAYGVAALQKAMQFCEQPQMALDVGCGAGGRLVLLLQSCGIAVTGVDVSAEMVRLATRQHPDGFFFHADICAWDSDERFDIVFAWDSIFHLPLAQHKPVLKKLCALLSPGGVLLYSFGNAIGDHTSEWRGDRFYYSSIGINENLRTLMDEGLGIRHLELSQYPGRHVFVIAQRNQQ